jgi:CRISPR-associated endonuclease/helicase Cas3
MMPFVAHGPDHLLVEHLRAVAATATQFAPSGAGEWAHLAGLWHDLGKFRPGFQSYVRQDRDAHVEGRPVVTRKKTHSAAGALHALHSLEAEHGTSGRRLGWLLAQLIASHHHGLYDHAALQNRLLGTGAEDSRDEWTEAAEACRLAHPELLSLPADFDPLRALQALPGLASGSAGGEQEQMAVSFALRMLFSGLVDADFLDTEAYFDRSRSSSRGGFPPLAKYRERLDAHLDDLARRVREEGRGEDAVMRARASVLADCRRAARWPPGVFALQVPTGGGKTLASLAFALAHADTHRLDRVIVAIPYTSIVEQTADVLAGIFGRDALVEHHSQADAADDDARSTARSRLACENWDAPLVVTTNVQLLESLFAAKTSRCRKLHRLQRSVIVLDEAQTLPPPFLAPTLAALRLLATHYRVSIVSCTATQPVLTDLPRFDPRQSLRGLTRGAARPHDIVPDTDPLYATLQRVRLRWPDDLRTAAAPGEIASAIAGHPAVLAIVNTRADASEVLAAVDAAAPDGQRTLHLSAAMCGQHRADVIAQIRARLRERARGDETPLRVVSTQLVEAGVDVDFPVVFRALAGLDSIAQAAGRCNREGRLGRGGGRVEVFVRPVPRALGALSRAVDATRAVLGDERPESLPPALFQRYFAHWYGLFGSLDEREVTAMLRTNAQLAFQFESAARAYRLVDDENQCSVVVPYAPASGDTAARDAALAALERGEPERWQLRALQRYVVQAPQRDVMRWLARGDVAEPSPGWFVLRDAPRYDPRRGLLREGAALDAASLFQ